MALLWEHFTSNALTEFDPMSHSRDNWRKSIPWVTQGNGHVNRSHEWLMVFYTVLRNFLFDAEGLVSFLTCTLGLRTTRRATVTYHMYLTSERWLSFTPSTKLVNNTRNFIFFRIFFNNVMLTCEKIPVSPLFRTASDKKLGGAWEQALKFGHITQSAVAVARVSKAL